ncbi:ribosome-recycling factor [Pokkaliibacter plantistimulans]|uniref:Ribosome-recycling factor n=2 Tax=Pseudomonadota TaxID=1224 RepID=A0ABX5M5I8_9GAMM|nr:ribosome recycling factor [Pokkaliibacter plantistimulans]PPC74895.1 ribosome recycling factor [Pokkaliibacter plantistimulans]PXF32916.1 ribosome-recycling factor [Pokkaliibacter plantistimulans]
MIEDIKRDAEQRMQKSIESLEGQFNKIRTGRATPAILDVVRVSYYGVDTPLSQVANVIVEDARTLLISPWEKKLVPEIEKAIYRSDLGLNPNTTGDVIRVPMPPLTEETRKTYIKQARQEAENARVAIRNVRRDANGMIKDLLKEKEISEDDQRRAEEAIQKVTDKYIADVDKHLESKEADLMAI